MRKLIFIAVLALASCKKDCYLVDKYGNNLGNQRKSYNEYNSKGTTQINGVVYYKTTNDLIEVCN